uniref:Uncharacterized protein n=1 Tax=Oryza sativa subsp. japonica TaxID=39947 RepID=Q33AJ0_ORYSJ|nr:hypothetical protein LOC_Os10g09750 [Oryza sativa Japonica Group]
MAGGGRLAWICHLHFPPSPLATPPADPATAPSPNSDPAAAPSPTADPATVAFSNADLALAPFPNTDPAAAALLQRGFGLLQCDHPSPSSPPQRWGGSAASAGAAPRGSRTKGGGGGRSGVDQLAHAVGATVCKDAVRPHAKRLSVVVVHEDRMKCYSV